MKSEITDLEENNTLELVTLPSTKKPIGCRWVYKVKLNFDGSIERYKDRLVVKAFTKTRGSDYFETFSLIAKMNTIRIVLSLASINNWHLFQMKGHNAFIQGDLNEDVYMHVQWFY